MRSGYLHVAYEDGNTEDIPLKPVGIIAAERKYGGDFPVIEGTIYAAWVVKGKPGDFDEWVASLLHATDQGEAPAGPLDQGQSPEG